MTEKRIRLFYNQKEDWWWKSQGKVIGPRGELVEEMRQRAGVPFYVYQADRFLEQAGTFLNQEVSKEAIDEAHDLALLEAEEEQREEAKRRLAGAVATGVSTNASDLGGSRIPSPSALPDVAAAQAAREYLNSPAAEAAREVLNSPAARAAQEFMNSPQVREISRIQEQLRRMGL
jgi:hypothetical protein